MGWANCGYDSEGRPIGYAYDAICDHPGCNEKIDRGLAYACGGMHGDCGGTACEKYFCYKHLQMVNKRLFDDLGIELDQGLLCSDCYDFWLKEFGSYVMSGDFKCEWAECKH